LQPPTWSLKQCAETLGPQSAVTRPGCRVRQLPGKSPAKFLTILLPARRHCPGKAARFGCRTGRSLRTRAPSQNTTCTKGIAHTHTHTSTCQAHLLRIQVFGAASMCPFCLRPRPNVCCTCLHNVTKHLSCCCAWWDIVVGQGNDMPLPLAYVHSTSVVRMQVKVLESTRPRLPTCCPLPA
jgi:hypothetical protein